MNIFKTIVTICLVAFLYVTADAQDFYDEFRAKSIDVEGVKIGQKMTYDQFVAKFGKPDRYKQDIKPPRDIPRKTRKQRKSRKRFPKKALSIAF